MTSDAALDSGFAAVTSEGPRGAPSLVVVPPLGLPGGILDPFVARLTQRLHVLVVELPGAGHASTAPASVTTRELGASLARVIERLAAPRCHLFGISFGGMVAQWTAIDSPGLVDRLVLASTAARGLDAALAGPLHKLALARALVGASEPRAALAGAVVSDEVRHDPVEMRRIEDEIAETPREATELAWLAAAAARHDARELLRCILSPTLVLSGDDDSLIPVDLQDELARAITGSHRAIVHGAGHDVTLDRPEETARIVDAFVRGVGP